MSLHGSVAEAYATTPRFHASIHVADAFYMHSGAGAWNDPLTRFTSLIIKEACGAPRMDKARVENGSNRLRLPHAPHFDAGYINCL